MKYSNHYSLNSFWTKFLLPPDGEDHPPTEGRFSVTDLIGPPRIRTLKIKYWDILEEDISERVWRVDGIIMDEKLSQVAESFNVEGQRKRYLLKYKMEKKIGVNNKRPTIVGVPDVIDTSHRRITDWKKTLQSKVTKEDFNDWWKQLDIYSYLYNTQNPSLKDQLGCFGVEEETLSIFIRDFRLLSSRFNTGISIPIVERSRLVSRMAEIENYIKDRLKDHLENPERECLAEEKWNTEDLFAIIKRGNKRALKVCDSEKEAIRYLNSKKIKDEKKASCYSLEVRPGISKRCQKYCPVREVCEYSPAFNKERVSTLSPPKEQLWKEIIPETIINTADIAPPYIGGTPSLQDLVLEIPSYQEYSTPPPLPHERRARPRPLPSEDFRMRGIEEEQS